MTAAEVNDVALCHGWITGHRKAYDDVTTCRRAPAADRAQGV
ncbi:MULTISPECIES: hypothetical protein [Streptomyces]|nr:MULTISPECIES: hypothetical protein [Streptomyces]WCL88567.1 hypothetical protein PPN52_30415 [Streptomyces sp. JCM 35825]